MGVQTYAQKKAARLKRQAGGTYSFSKKKWTGVNARKLASLSKGAGVKKAAKARAKPGATARKPTPAGGVRAKSAKARALAAKIDARKKAAAKK